MTDPRDLLDEVPADAVDAARVTVFKPIEAAEQELETVPLVGYADRDYADVPGLVHDRIEVSGVFEHVDLPDPGDDSEPLGVVAWGADGRPRRLECNNGAVVTWTDDVPRVEPPE